jgi:hypothetical protein
MAAVDLGEDAPAPVGVVQVTDGDKAEDGMATLLETCDPAGEGSTGTEPAEGTGGWVVDGDWLVVAETEDIAQQVVDATGEGTLADDATYQEWTDEVGDPGVMSMYAAPEAGRFLATFADQLGQGMVPGLPGAVPPMDGGATGELPEELTTALEDFEGMAATLRFNDGALEFEAATASADEEQMQMLATDRGDDVVTTLPEDTAVAIGFGFAEGWMQAALEQAVAASGGETTAEDMEAQLQAMTGLTVADLETLLGDSAAISLGSDIDPEAIFGSGDGSNIPVAAKVQGDASGIQDVLATLTESMGSEASFLGSDAEGDVVAIGPSADYRGSVLGDGDLGDSEVYQNVVRESDEASALVYVNFDANDWLTGLVEGEQEAQDNLEPLQGLGLSTWVDDGTSHGVFRLTTN